MNVLFLRWRNSLSDVDVAFPKHRSKTGLQVLLLFCVLATTPTHGLSQEAVWRHSYQLEAAGRFTEAIVALEPVLANSHDAELKLIRKGWLNYLSGNYNESIRQYRFAMERNGNSVDARLGLTLPLLAQSRWREAEQSAKSALELAPNNYAGLLRLAIAEEGQRNWSAMAGTAATMVMFYPGDASAYVYLARANAWLNKRREAEAAYNAVLARFPGHLEAKWYLEKK